VDEQPARMFAQLQDIGNRYLARTLRDVDQLRSLVAQGMAGDAHSAKASEQLAHTIHGSGAMFGFDELSELAGQIERLVSQRTADLASVGPALTTLLSQLQHAVQQAATARGVSA
jgi:HPt (histidine-containing phosphotransfer) domain-containing protein